ncbi:MAG: HNH endonuclease [Ardenticatenaceae bacterium]
MGYRENFFKHNPGFHDRWICFRCGKILKKSEVEVDHILPQSKGGPDDHWNLQGLCRPCNREKYNKIDLGTAKDFGKKIVWQAVKKVWPFK